MICSSDFVRLAFIPLAARISVTYNKRFFSVGRKIPIKQSRCSSRWESTPSADDAAGRLISIVRKRRHRFLSDELLAVGIIVGALGLCWLLLR